MDKIWVFAGLFIIALIGSLVINTVDHEGVHKQIDIYYGCTNVSVTYSLAGGSTSCHNFNNLTISDRDRMYELHSFNEIIGYNVGSLIAVMFFCSLIIVLAIFSRNK